MASELQDIVDQIAIDLGGATVVEDAQQRMVVYSSQPGPVDEVRRDSIMRRETVPAVIEWFRRFGISEAHELMWIPGNDGLGILGRVCYPVRYRGQLLGFIWILDDQREVYESRRERVSAYYDHLALLLYEQHLAHRLRGELVSHLLSEVPDLQTSAAASIADRELWPRGAHACAVVASVIAAHPDGASEPGPDGLHRALVQSLESVAHNTVGSDALRVAFAEHVVLLVPCWSERDERPVEVADHVVAAISRCLEDDSITLGGMRVVAGVGDPQPELHEAHSSYLQARLAAKVAGVIPRTGSAPRWRDLGVFRTLAQLPSWGAQDLALDPRVAVLMRDGDADVLRSLETYLDLGCDVQRTAAMLHAHRGTVYYRLEKVERLSGLDLRDGNDRLSAHLGFKIARLSGIYPPAPSGSS